MKQVWHPLHRRIDKAPPDELKLSAEYLDLLAEHVRSAIPHEACGFLAGVGGKVRGIFPVPNIAPDPASQFVMDPQAQWNAMRAMSERGWQMLAIYHSHPPEGKAELSQSDVAAAYYPEALLLLIVPDFSGQISVLRAFAIDAGRVYAVSIAVTS